MPLVGKTEILDISNTMTHCVASAAVCANAYRLDASAFLNHDKRTSLVPGQSRQILSDLADVFTVYIQTPVLCYVIPFEHSRPYLTTSELGEYQRGAPTHVSLVTDPRLIAWKITHDTIVLSRSGRVGEAYWVDKKLAGALVGDSFRVIPKLRDDAYFVYALLSSPYARNYVSGVTYGSVVDHASVDQVRSIPVPIISDRSRSRIDKLVQQAVRARDAAYDLQDAADSLVLRSNSLTDIQEFGPPTFDPLAQPDCFLVSARTMNVSSKEGSEYRLDAHFYNPIAQQAVANIRRNRNSIKTVGEVARVFMGPRFKRNYVEAQHGVPFLSGKNIIQIRQTDLNYIANLQIADMKDLLVKGGWTLITRSGTIGRTCFVWNNYEDYAASEHILRVIPDESKIDPGYLYAFLSSRYGYEQILRYRHGSVIDEVTDTQIEQVLVPCPSRKEQMAIGNKVREAYEKRAEAIRLEDEAQAILMKELTQVPGTKGA
jgi:type I restriction enzyme S subunit